MRELNCRPPIPPGEQLEGRAVAFAEGNALGKGPQVLRLSLEDIAWIRRNAAAGNPVFMQLEVRTAGRAFASSFIRILFLNFRDEYRADSYFLR